MNTILITCHHLKNYAGSECMVLDFCHELTNQGYEVVVATFEFEKPIKDDFLSQGIKVVNVLEGSLESLTFDLIISFHWVVLFSLLNKGVKASKVVGFSLGTAEPLEFPAMENRLYSWYFYNSKECMSFYQAKLQRQNPNQEVFLNSVNHLYFNQPMKTFSKLQNVAVVSNHLPDELLRFNENIESNNLKIDFYGRASLSKHVLITPDILIKYDAVITIGRTVQYCLVLGIPVYCYDKFGGPGFITPDNCEKAEYYNYSGRCTPGHVTTESILSDLTNTDVAQLAKNSEYLKNVAENKYSLGKNLEQLINKSYSSSSHTPDLSAPHYQYLFNLTDLYIKVFKKVKNSEKKMNNLQIKDIKREEFANKSKLRISDLKSKIIVRDELLRCKNKKIKSQQKKTLNKPQKKIDLSISYNFFNGEELLEQSINNIRNEASHISIIYQEISNHGNAITTKALDLLHQLKRNGVIDRLHLYKPDLALHPSINEFKKRKIGLKIATNLGLTHFLNMDADEFYILDQFRQAKDIILKENITSSSVGSYFYVKKPIWRSELPDKTNVCFISEINDELTHRHKGVFPTVNVDPTRRFVNFSGNYRHFSGELIMMHHMNLVRNSLESKLRNSTNAEKIEFMLQVRKAVDEWEFGELFDFPNKPEQKIVEVNNLFNLDGCN
jgi:hypothetical protein